MSPLISDPPLVDVRCEPGLAGETGLSLAAREISLWCATLDDPSPDEMRRLTAVLSADETDRADAFRFVRDRRRYIVGRGILRRLLGRYLGVPPQEIVFAYGANGKPCVARPEGCPSIHFNVAHSEGVALLAFSRSGEIGVDIEYVRDMPDFDGVASLSFSAVELQRWRACPPSCRREEFFAAWTRQEALLKATGTGLGGEPPDAMSPAWEVYALRPAPGFVAALAVPPDHEWATVHAWPLGSGRKPSRVCVSNSRMRLAALAAAGPIFP